MESRFRLTVRTSMMSEYRDAAGALGAFELSHRFTTAGALRTALSPTPRRRVRFRAHLVVVDGPESLQVQEASPTEISIPFEDIRIAPFEAGAVYPETEELLRMLAESLLPRWQSRQRSRYFGG